jgi:hypothetical protein
MAEMVSFELATQSVVSACANGLWWSVQARGTPDFKVSEPNVLEIMLPARAGVRATQSDHAREPGCEPTLDPSSRWR